MIILSFGDIHFRDTCEFRPWNKSHMNGLSYESNRIIKTTEFIRDKILELKPNIVINLGDTFSSMTALSISTIYVAGVCMRMLEEACKEVTAEFITILGNHDIYSSDSNIHSPKIFEGDNIRLVQDFEINSYSDCKLGFLSYTDKKILYEMNYHTAITECDYVFTHNSFRGAVFNSFYKDDGGMDPGRGKATVITGHAHIPQILGKVHYVGSPMQWRWRECEFDIPRGIMIIDTESDTKMWYKNTYVKDMAIISKLDDLKKFPSDKYAIKYIGPEIDEKKFVDYEYDKVFISKSLESVRISYINKIHIDPLMMLNSYIKDSFPELEEVHNEVINVK